MSAPSPPPQVTTLLAAWRAGDSSALDRLLPLVANELQRLAANYMRREHAGHTLQTTALVNEAYPRLVDQQSVEWTLEQLREKRFPADVLAAVDCLTHRAR